MALHLLHRAIQPDPLNIVRYLVVRSQSCAEFFAKYAMTELLITHQPIRKGCHVWHMGVCGSLRWAPYPINYENTLLPSADASTGLRPYIWKCITASSFYVLMVNVFWPWYDWNLLGFPTWVPEHTTPSRNCCNVGSAAKKLRIYHRLLATELLSDMLMITGRRTASTEW